jgi:uncharacterized RDD family membrane protein YckC
MPGQYGPAPGTIGPTAHPNAHLGGYPNANPNANPNTGAPPNLQANPNAGPYQTPYGGPHGAPGGPWGQQGGTPYPTTANAWPAATGPRTADGVPLANWGWRFLAGILDLIITSIVSALFALPIYLKMLPVVADYVNKTMAAAERGGTPPALNPNDLMSGTDQILVTAISVAVGLLYFTVFWRLKGATPAQLLCGLRVVPAGEGRHTGGLPWTQSLLRAVVWIVPLTVGSYLLLFAILNVLFPLWNANRQAIHDLAARSQLVKIK